jgi:acetyltransferase-like isoleucine patch superfamily enzyme/dTDP-4-dehydrorhamnose 3,5-epimerase-like enzyme
MSDAHFAHAQALVETTRIGPRTRIWAFAHLLPGATVGADCNICDHVFIENDVVVGDRVTVKCGVQLWDGVRLEDDVFVGPNVTFTNDRFPRSRQRPEAFLKTLVRRGASIGANATILPGLTIGAHSMIAAGSAVTKDVPPNAIVVGNPATISGYVNVRHEAARVDRALPAAKAKISSTQVKGVTLHSLPTFDDLRGDLTALEFGSDVPFAPRRCFFVYGVPNSRVRGEHAHRQCHQFLVCVSGECTVVVDDGKSSDEFELDQPGLGIHVPPMVWSVQYKYSADATLMVLASHPYDAADYIRDYDKFLEELNHPKKA